MDNVPSAPVGQDASAAPPPADAAPADAAAVASAADAAAPQAPPDPEPPADRTWYVMAMNNGGCLPLDVALGVGSPDEFIKEAAKKGGNYRYVRNGDDMAMVTEPLSGAPPIAFVRGKNACVLAMKMIQNSGQ